MKPEIIVQNDFLDILFYNRNKDYGAYVLRRYYNRRLVKSILCMSLFVALISSAWFVDARFFKPALTPVIEVKDVNIEHLAEKKVKPKEVNKAQSLSKMKQVANPPIVIVPDNMADTSIRRNADMDHAQIGLVTQDGRSDSSYVSHGGSSASDSGTAEPPAIAAIEPDNTPFDRVEIMPEFPGGIDGLIRYLTRSLGEPDGLEEGEKVVVKARFVVGRDGSVSDVEIIDGDKRYNTLVQRVIAKMPAWKPGVQHGMNVPVYFNLPVVFQQSE